jgi:PAS domain S-box-containing protein
VTLDAITDGVFTVDEDWRITCFNAAAERITGVPRAEAVGSRCCDVFRASICERSCALRRTMETGRPAVNETVFIVNAAGERIPISISTAVLRDPAGRIIGGVETFRDLSLVEQLRTELRSRYTFSDIIGRSKPMRELFEIIPEIAEADSTVLLEGESGTGKELVARAIHDLSPRKDGPFVAVNCGALPDTLLERELCGHKAGAFTDARADKPGRFALADGGTILLDEVADVSPAMQSRLLRVLQERIVEPLGSVRPVKVDVRVIAATNRSLPEMTAQGGFREDLYFRLNVIRLELPPLRARREDIPLLAEHFIEKLNRRTGKNVPGLSDEAMAVLLSHDYSGNVRELENLIEHAFVLCRGGVIQPRHLPAEVRGDRPDQPGRAPMTLAAMEAVMIAEAVRRHGGNRTAAARELGINPSTLHRKVRSLGIRLPDARGGQ